MAEDDEIQERWPLTPRTTYVMLLAVELIADQIRMDIEALEGRALTRNMLDKDEPTIHQMDSFPPQTWAQSAPWWHEMAKAADRVAAELRADHWWYAPRTPAEEAVIHVATVDAEQVLDMSGPNSPPAASPELRDEDVVLAWEQNFDGIGDPTNEINQELGIGDYRLQNWHRIFSGRIRNGDDS